MGTIKICPYVLMSKKESSYVKKRKIICQIYNMFICMTVVR